jgi:serine/threonine protein phosphatase PrpC
MHLKNLHIITIVQKQKTHNHYNMDLETFVKKYQQAVNETGVEINYDLAKQIAKPIFDLAQLEQKDIIKHTANLKEYKALRKQCQSGIEKMYDYIASIHAKVQAKSMAESEGEKLMMSLAKQVQESELMVDKLESQEMQAQQAIINIQKNLIRSMLSDVEKKKPATAAIKSKSTSSTKYVVQYMYSLSQEQMDRDHMEDFMNVINTQDGLLLAIICDGHGGSDAAKWVATQFPRRMKTLMSKYQTNYKGLLNGTLASLVHDWDVSKKIMSWDEKQQKEVPDHADASGTTISAVLLDRKSGELYTLNLGDSRVLVFDAVTQKLVLQTKDHDLNDPQERKRVENLELLAEPGVKCKVSNENGDSLRVQDNIAVARAFGDNMLDIQGCLSRDADVMKFQLQPPYQYFILMGSDGLYDDLTTMEIRDILFNGKLKNAQTFTDRIKDKHDFDSNVGQDNTTVVLIKTEPSNFF